MASLKLYERDIDSAVEGGLSVEDILGLHQPVTLPPPVMSPDQQQRMSDAIGLLGATDAATMGRVHRGLGGLAGLMARGTGSLGQAVAPTMQGLSREQMVEAQHQDWIANQYQQGIAGPGMANVGKNVAMNLSPYVADVGLGALTGSPFGGMVGMSGLAGGAQPGGGFDPASGALAGGEAALTIGALRALGPLAARFPVLRAAAPAAAFTAAYETTDGTETQKIAAGLSAAGVTGAAAYGEGPLRTYDREGRLVFDPREADATLNMGVGPRGGGGKRFEVVDKNGDVHGRHETREAAEARIARIKGMGPGGEKLGLEVRQVGAMPTKAEIMERQLTPVENPVGLRGEAPLPDVVPRSKGGVLAKGAVPNIRSFMAPPVDEPPSIFSPPDKAGKNLGFSFKVRSDLDAPEYKYKDEDKQDTLASTSVPGETFILGRPTDEQFFGRIDRYVPQKDTTLRQAAAKWYGDNKRVVLDLIRDPEMSEGDRLYAGLAGNKASSPMAATLQGITAVEEKHGSEVPRSMGYADADIQEAVRGGGALKRMYGFQTFKLSDFIDSHLGKVTRTAMNNDPRGGAPVAVDMVGARSRGGFDDKLRNQLLKHVSPKDAAKLKKRRSDAPPTKSLVPTPGQYERTADDYRRLTAEANKRNFGGVSDWKPHEIQALDWVAYDRNLEAFTGHTRSGGNLPSEIQDKFTRTMSIEVDLPDEVTSKDPELKYLNDSYRKLTTLKPEVTGEIGRAQVRLAESLVGAQPGAATLNRVAPTWWEGPGNLTVVFDLVGAEDTTAAIAEAGTAIGRQKANFSLKPNPKGPTLGFVLKSEAFKDPDVAQRAYLLLKDALAEKKILLPGGFTPTSAGGVPSVTSLYEWRVADVENPPQSADAKTPPRPKWKPGKETVGWLDTNTKTGKTFVEEAADTIRRQSTNPKFHAKIDDAVASVADKLGVEIEGGFQNYDALIHDNPDPETASGPISRLRKARRPIAAELVERTLGRPYADAFGELIRAARDLERARLYGAAGDPGSRARVTAPFAPSLHYFARENGTGAPKLVYSIPVKPGEPHHKALRKDAMALAERERIGFPDAVQRLYRMVDPTLDEQRQMKAWYKTGFDDRKTGKPVDRQTAMAEMLDSIGSEAEALNHGFNRVPQTPQEIQLYFKRRDQAIADGLDSSLVIPMTEDAVMWWQNENVQRRVKARYEAAKAQLREDFPEHDRLKQGGK